ncbi:MAG: Fic family protein [Clostridiales Family XIII bacterium]|nr:Fic family protein [Clostridiales Family XIII bacterium]
MDLYNQLLEEKRMQYKGGLYHETQIKLAYNSNRIEGSSLTEEQTLHLFDTRSILARDENTSERFDDYMEMNNHFILFNYMLDTAKEKLTEEIIKSYHRILKYGTSDAEKDWFAVGDYKKVRNVVGNITTSDSFDVKEDMENLLIIYNATKDKSIESVVDFHVRFETIHPFQDGNGRVGRIILFRECLANNITPFIIEDNNKVDYYNGLKDYYNNPSSLLGVCKEAQDVYSQRMKYFSIPAQHPRSS